MATTQDYINQLKVDKQNLVSMLNNMGVEASDSETFTSLTPKVGTIVTDPILQDKSITITENGTTNIVADEDYNGLNNVEVIANIPSKEPILQDKTVEITENGTTTITADSGYDGLNNVNVTTNVASSGGETPEIGFVINEFDSNGFATNVSTVGFTTIPAYYFTPARDGSSTVGGALKNLKTIKINEGITTIKGYTFYCMGNIEKIILPKTLKKMEFRSIYGVKNTNLRTMELPDGLEYLGGGNFSNSVNPNLGLSKLPSKINTIEYQAFYKNVNITIKTIPDSLTSINYGVFYGCTGITQVSMNKVTTIVSAANSGSFANCTNLKATWIGSAITSVGNLTFNGCSNLKKIFIDLPRATVEAMSDYSSAFSNGTLTSDVIVCNDDAGFITKEAFDATTW